VTDDNGGDFKGDEGIENQLTILRQMNQQGKLRGCIAVVMLTDKELSFHIGGEFDTLTNQLGMLEQAKDACRLYAQQRKALKQKAGASNPSWGPGGNA
jgi:hypothetical protein